MLNMTTASDNPRIRIANLYRNGLNTYRKRKHISVNDWAKRAGVGESTLREFLNGTGTHILQLDTITMLADAEHCSISDFLEPEEYFITHSIEAEGEMLTLPEAEKIPARLPITSLKGVEAAIIRGNSMFPYFRDGWIVFYSRKYITNVPHIGKYAQVGYNLPDSGVNYSEFFDKPALIHLKDGRILLRELKPGSERGRYNLRSFNAPDMENVEIRAAYKIVFIKTDLTNNL